MQQCNSYIVFSQTDGGRSHSKIGWRQTVGTEHDHFPMLLARVQLKPCKWGLVACKARAKARLEV